MTGLVVDLFAGGGGASVGIEAALGRAVDIAINHDETALAVHRANHPATRHLEADIWEVRPREAVGGRSVELLWASPDCTHFSVAKGDVPRSAGIRSLAWVVVRWARDVRPRVIALENVSEFRGWGPLGADGRPDKARMGQTFARWRAALVGLGYQVDYRILDASLYGAPTKRRRLFLVARCDGQAIRWPEPTHGPGRLPLRTAAECIDWSLPCPSIFERKKPLAEKTLWRIAQGIRRFVLENPKPFIVGLAHGEHRERAGGRSHGGDRSHGLDEPLRTIHAGGNNFALVTAFLAKHFGGVVGQQLTQPASTVTSKDHHGLVAASLVKFRGTSKGHPGCAPVQLPLPTITAGGMHVAEVRAFLTTFYSSGSVGQKADKPLRTVTSKHRLGLVTIEGTDYQIVDIGMRMLEPHELLRAQFGRFAAGYDLGAARTKSAKVRLIGNSVCPEVAEAVIREQFAAGELEATA